MRPLFGPAATFVAVRIIAGVALGAAAIIIETPAVAAEGAPGLVFSREHQQFGAVRQGEEIAAEFSFVNRGVVPLTLSPPITACDCAATIVGSGDIDPGGTGTIRITCDTSRMAGTVRRTVTVHSSEVSRRSVLLSLEGEVELDVISEPLEIYLGTVLRGQRVENAFSVRLGSDGQRSTAIRGAGTSGPYVDVDWQRGEVTFDLTVRSRAPLGPFSQQVAVSTSSTRFPVWNVLVSGVVVDAQPPSRW